MSCVAAEDLPRPVVLFLVKRRPEQDITQLASVISRAKRIKKNTPGHPSPLPAPPLTKDITGLKILPFKERKTSNVEEATNVEEAFGAELLGRSLVSPGRCQLEAAFA